MTAIASNASGKPVQVGDTVTITGTVSSIAGSGNVGALGSVTVALPNSGNSITVEGTDISSSSQSL